MPVTLRDVAERAGVSASAVSRTLGCSKREVTRHRVAFARRTMLLASVAPLVKTKRPPGEPSALRTERRARSSTAFARWLDKSGLEYGTIVGAHSPRQATPADVRKALGHPAASGVVGGQ